jgi:Leucine-rich repeat (LRR) protein
MKRALKVILPVILIIGLITTAAWYFLLHRPDATADFLMQQAEKMRSQQRYERAITYYELAWKLAPYDDELPLQLADTYIDTGNFTKAEYVLVQAISAKPSSVELYVVLCQTYVAQDKLLDAVQMLDRVADPTVKMALDTLRPTAPTVLPESGYYSDYVTLSVDAGSSSVYLSTDGEYPTMSKNLFQGDVTLPGGETTVIAIAVNDQTGLVSHVSMSGYTVGGVVEPIVLNDTAIDYAVRTVLEKHDGSILQTSDLWDIKELTLEQPTDLAELSHFSALRSLTVQNVSGLDFSVLVKLPNLEYLDLSGCTISSNSMQAIGSLSMLKTLKLNGCALTGIDSMAQLTALKELDVSNNIINNIGILSLMLDLETVHLANNPISSIAALATCKQLKYLDISNCEVASLASLKDKTQLQTLLAPNNNLASLDDLSQCTLLEVLDIEVNLVADISVLAGLNNLRIFKADNNQISAVPVFDAELSTLQQFSIDYNQVTDLSGLSGLEQLNYINADYNAVTDLKPLGECPNLVQLNIWDNPVLEEDVKLLQEYGIIVNYNPNYTIPEVPEE